jgi:hypothetical protein
MRSSARCPKGDPGAALLTVLLVGIILTGLGLALVRTAVVNLDNAGRDRVSSGALGVAEAGITSAIGYLRGNGVNQICATCATPWNTLAPMTLTFSTGSAVVEIRAVERYAPPTVPTGRYLIRSVGRTSGTAPGRRTVEQLIDIKPFAFPLGVYTSAKANLGGTVQITQESFFSGQCIDSRSKMSFVAGPGGSYIDPYNDVPAGAHSVSYITDTNSNVCSTDLEAVRNTDGGAVHASNPCHETYWADQSALGGVFTSSTCATKTAGKGDYGTNGSGFSLDVLRDRYGFTPRGLTDDQFAMLKARAKAAGTWFPAGQAVVIPPASRVPGAPGYNPIVYVEDQELSLGTGFNSYAWASDPSCVDLHPSVLLVIERGRLKLGSSTNFTGNLFVPDGDISFAGGAVLTGTAFTKNLKFTGSGTIGLNDCAARGTHGGLLSISKTRFREVDQ